MLYYCVTQFVQTYYRVRATSEVYSQAILLIYHIGKEQASDGMKMTACPTWRARQWLFKLSDSKHLVTKGASGQSPDLLFEMNSCSLQPHHRHTTHTHSHTHTSSVILTFLCAIFSLFLASPGQHSCHHGVYQHRAAVFMHESTPSGPA